MDSLQVFLGGFSCFWIISSGSLAGCGWFSGGFEWFIVSVVTSHLFGIQFLYSLRFVCKMLIFLAYIRTSWHFLTSPSKLQLSCSMDHQQIVSLLQRLPPLLNELFYLKENCFILEISRLLCFCEMDRFQNLWRHPKRCYIMEVTVNAYFF